MKTGTWVEKVDHDKQQALIAALQTKVDSLQKQLDDLMNTLFGAPAPAPVLAEQKSEEESDIS